MIQSDDRSVELGAFTRKVSVNVEVRTRWFCAYLLPAEEVDGGVQFNTFAAPLARAGIHLAEQLAGDLAGQPYAGVSGGTRRGDNGVTLSFDRTGTRIIKVFVICGGDATKPPAIGREFIGKRFTAKVSFPLTRDIKWGGLIKPDN